MYFDATEFAARLSTLRKAQGMTQEEMAEALNISLEHLSKMERGKRKPSIDLIIAMACYFHVSTDYLLMGKDHDIVNSRTKLLDVVTQLTEIAKSLQLCAGSFIPILSVIIDIKRTQAAHPKRAERYSLLRRQSPHAGTD